MFFPVEFQDVWMKLIDGFNLNNIKCKIQNMVYKEVGKEQVDQIIEVYIKGYHSKTDINAEIKTQVKDLIKKINENQPMVFRNVKTLILAQYNTIVLIVYF